MNSTSGAIRKDDIVLLDYGWSARWTLRAPGAAFTADWPGLAQEAAQYLADTGIKVIGTDTFKPSERDDHYGNYEKIEERSLTMEGSR